MSEAHPAPPERTPEAVDVDLPEPPPEIRAEEASASEPVIETPPELPAATDGVHVEPPRRRAPSRHVERPALLPMRELDLDDVEPDEQFLMREVGEVAGLATSIARLGQLFPIDVRPRGKTYQVVAGFRRVAALKFLQRGTVLARVHEDLPDAEAWVYALGQALEARGLSPDEIRAVRERLEGAGQLTTMARGLIDAALTVPGSDLEPEDPNAPAGDEVDLDALASELHERLNGISGDLALITELWTAIEPGPRAELLDQLRYYGELHAYLSRLR